MYNPEFDSQQWGGGGTQQTSRLNINFTLPLPFNSASMPLPQEKKKSNGIAWFSKSVLDWSLAMVIVGHGYLALAPPKFKCPASHLNLRQDRVWCFENPELSKWPIYPFFLLPGEDTSIHGQSLDSLAHSWRAWAPDHQWGPLPNDSSLQTTLLPQKTRDPKSFNHQGRHNIYCLQSTTYRNSHSWHKTNSQSIQGARKERTRLKTWQPDQFLDSCPSGLSFQPWRLFTLQHGRPLSAWGHSNWFFRTGAPTHLSFHFCIKFSSPTHLLWWEADSGSVKAGVWLPHE